MKYKKGTFVIVPNLEELKCKPSEMQAIYLWICQHTDCNGLCFPKKTTIGKEAGCSHNTVDKYLKKLVEDGFLEITPRKNKEGKNTSNEYQLLIMGGTPTQNWDVSQPNIGSQTIPNITISTLTKDIQQVVEPVNEEEVTSIVATSSMITLPLHRGKYAHQRVDSIYNDLFNDKYGFYPPVALIGSRLKVFKEVLVSYSEIQTARLLITFFEWRGMLGDSDWEEKKITGATHSIYIFKSNLTQYEAKVRNIDGQSKEFSDDVLLLPIVGNYMINLSK